MLEIILFSKKLNLNDVMEGTIIYNGMPIKIWQY